jgi:hypothetical protein
MGARPVARLSPSGQPLATADTVMTRPSADLMREVFPGTELRGEISGNATLLSIDRAARVLGFGPAHSWRDHVSG